MRRLSPVIFFNLVMGVIGSFQYFTQAYIMTGGGALFFLSLPLSLQPSLAWMDMGYASAMAWILFFVMMIFTGRHLPKQGEVGSLWKVRSWLLSSEWRLLPSSSS